MAVAVSPGSTSEKVVNLSATVFPRHHALIQAVRASRAATGDIPNKSDVVKEAIEDLARRELDTARFEELMAAAA